MKFLTFPKIYLAFGWFQIDRQLARKSLNWGKIRFFTSHNGAIILLQIKNWDRRVMTTLGVLTLLSNEVNTGSGEADILRPWVPKNERVLQNLHLCCITCRPTAIPLHNKPLSYFKFNFFGEGVKESI